MDSGNSNPGPLPSGQRPRQCWAVAAGLPRRLLVLALGALGALALLTAPGPIWAAQELGETLFANHCAGCHVGGGNIIRRSKTLKLVALQRNGIDGAAAIAAIAAGGVGQMGGYAAVLGDGGAEAVGSWVWQQAQLGWPPA